MKHFTHPRFWELYDALPVKTRQLADKNFDLLKRDPQHPSLHFKRVGRFWSVRVGRDYRALVVESPEGRCGSGSGHTQSTTNCSSDKNTKKRPFSGRLF